ncbi:hypothetical protein B0H11DRAFT_2354487 [Mycena galericulata]|nr:hypothetical protein B0H11DRAFT_2354487 [Mycena galericulata]
MATALHSGYPTNLLTTPVVQWIDVGLWYRENNLRRVIPPPTLRAHRASQATPPRLATDTYAKHQLLRDLLDHIALPPLFAFTPTPTPTSPHLLPTSTHPPPSPAHQHTIHRVRVVAHVHICPASNERVVRLALALTLALPPAVSVPVSATSTRGTRTPHPTTPTPHTPTLTLTPPPGASPRSIAAHERAIPAEDGRASAAWAAWAAARRFSFSFSFALYLSSFVSVSFALAPPDPAPGGRRSASRVELVRRVEAAPTPAPLPPPTTSQAPAPYSSRPSTVHTPAPQRFPFASVCAMNSDSICAMNADSEDQRSAGGTRASLSALDRRAKRIFVAAGRGEALGVEGLGYMQLGRRGPSGRSRGAGVRWAWWKWFAEKSAPDRLYEVIVTRTASQGQGLLLPSTVVLRLIAMCMYTPVDLRSTPNREQPNFIPPQRVVEQQKKSAASPAAG